MTWSKSQRSSTEEMNEPLLIDGASDEDVIVNAMMHDDNYVRFISTNLNGDDKEHNYVPNIIITSRYTLMMFLPKSLLEQFRRLANVYFLVLGIIAAVGAYTAIYETSVAPAGILAPMTTVVLISIIKDGLEDIKRHQTDAAINARPAHLINCNSDGNTGSVSVVRWQDLTVGSLVLLTCDDEVPADIVPLISGGIQGNSCFVETAAIDGESNLKLRVSCLTNGSDSIEINENEVIKVSSNRFNISNLATAHTLLLTAESPNGSIHHFNGSVEFQTRNGVKVRQTLSDKNLLLRGSVLRATEWCIGIVVYTGSETKLSLNSKRPPSKLASIDRIVNRSLIIAISALLIVCFISMILSIIWQDKNENADYLCLHEDALSNIYKNGGGCSNGSTSSTLTILTFMTLYNNFVCISMYVSLEMVYLCQAHFLAKDLELYDETSDTPAECHTSGMCADLGQIQFVLSDKTGTLTKNVMRVRRCSIAGNIYGEPILIPSNNSKIIDHSEQNKIIDWKSLKHLKIDAAKGDSEILTNFFRVMTACNTVMLMPENGVVNVNDFQSLKDCLQAESPDEVALVLAAAEFAGTLLVQRDVVDITVAGIVRAGPVKINEKIQLLAVNGFDSDRKRMSVLVRIDGKPILLCKGADSSMINKCIPDEHTDQCLEHIELFSASGLRTLVLSKRDLTEEYVETWLKQYNMAINSIVNREEDLRKCASIIEEDMTLLGTVGIEDELQDGVAEAVQLLQNAGINVWMITGDKAETAIAIGKMCSLLGDHHHIERVLRLSGEALRQRIFDLHTYILSGRKQFNSDVKFEDLALVVDGESLEGIWASDDLKQRFCDSVQSIPTVLACRVSPLQKASLVRMVKTSSSSPVTLAIGDGANDVGMIHEARVGVGISGREGRHAANSADFAIGQFRFLPILLLGHGRFNYIRCSKLVLYSFFKNLVLVSTLFYYSMYSGYSGTIPLDSIVFSGFNFYLGLPIVCLGALDFDVSRNDAFRHPRLAYATGRLGEMLNIKEMATWCIFAFIQGLILFVLVMRFIGGNIHVSDGEPHFNGIGLNDSKGQNGGLYVDGFCLFTIVVFSMQIKVITMTNTRTYLTWFLWIMSFAGYFLFVFVYGSIQAVGFYNILVLTFQREEFILALFLVPTTLFLSDLTVETLKSRFFPTNKDKFRALLENEKKEYASMSDCNDSLQSSDTLSGVALTNQQKKLQQNI